MSKKTGKVNGKDFPVFEPSSVATQMIVAILIKDGDIDYVGKSDSGKYSVMKLTSKGKMSFSDLLAEQFEIHKNFANKADADYFFSDSSIFGSEFIDFTDNLRSSYKNDVELFLVLAERHIRNAATADGIDFEKEICKLKAKCDSLIAPELDSTVDPEDFGVGSGNDTVH